MGLFDRFRSGAKKPVSLTAAAEKPPFIPVYDHFGRRFDMPREQWRTTILPGVLEKANHDPESLGRAICVAMDYGFFNDVSAASDRLLSLDLDRERSHFVRANLLMEAGQLEEAERFLLASLREFESSGDLLAILARVYAKQGDVTKAQSTYWRAIQQNPNQNKGLLWWATLERETNGESAFWEAMQKAADLPGSWRPQLWLAGYCLAQKNLAQAVRLYDHVLTHAPENPDVYTTVSGDLGRTGYATEMLQLLLPLYDPQRHGGRAGINLLRACLITRNSAEGERLLHALFLLEEPELKQHLVPYSDALEKLKRSEAVPPQQQRELAEIVFSSPDRPIWTYRLFDPKWLWSQRKRREERIVFFSLTDASRSDRNALTGQRDHELGRLSRAIPLYLAESIFFWTDCQARTVIPVARDRGLVLAGGGDWPEEKVFAIAEGATFVVTGSIEQDGNRFDVRLSLWDARKRAVVKRLAKSEMGSQIVHSALALEQELLGCLAGSDTLKTPREPWYRRPNRSEIGRYLGGLAESHSMSCFGNQLLQRETAWIGRKMLDLFLSLALQMLDAQSPRIMLLSALAQSKASGSEIYLEYRTQLLQLLKDEPDKKSPFYRLSPLLFKIYGMTEEFRQQSAELATSAEPQYRTWLDVLKNGKAQTP